MILYFLLCTSAIRLAYQLFFFLKLKEIRIANDAKREEVSVVICSKNNAEGLKRLLPSLLAQDYPLYEIVVVDDFSQDDTMLYLTSLNDSNVKIVKAEIDQPGKKNALHLGIENASFEWLLFTDSDCMPMGTSWISGMMNAREMGSSVVLGYGPFYKTSSLINAFARYESATIAMQYMSFAQSEIPYMGVGRNLLYTKSLYNSVGGFKSHDHIISGDDDLFIQEAGRFSKCTPCIDPQTFMYSQAKDTWSKYIQQKRRHVSTSTAYGTISKLYLGINSAAMVIFYLSMLFGIVTGHIATVAMIWLVYSLISLMFTNRWFRVLEAKTIWLFSPLLDLLSFIFYFVFAFNLIFKKNIEWS